MMNQSLREINNPTARRLLSTGSGILRRLCTSATSVAETVVARPEDAPSAGASHAKSDPLLRLRRRFLALGSFQGKIANILHMHIKEGHGVGKDALLSCLKELRKKKRYHHCLEIFEWMDKGKYGYSDKDHALRIDIICKSKGIAEAKKYFESLPLELKNLYTYGAFLNCYCTEKLVDKADDFFEQMDKLNYHTCLSFNNMMTLALNTGSPEKVPGLVEEMKRRNIKLNVYSYCLLMQSYRNLGNIEGVEKTVEEIEKGNVYCQWTIYSHLASIYISAGNFEKAEMALKKLEESAKNSGKTVPIQYHYLISFYASMGKLDEMNRIWNSLKSDTSQPISNLSYLLMIQSLAKLGEIEQMRKFYEDWKAGCKHFDIRITATVIGCYLKRNMIEECKQLFDDAVEKSGLPFFRGREMFISHFLGKRDINTALSHLREAVGVVKEKDKWRPDTQKVEAFWKYFEEEKDVDGAEEFSKLLKKLKCLDSSAYVSLLGIYVAAGKTLPEIRQRIKQDGIEITGDIELLLEKVCPE